MERPSTHYADTPALPKPDPVSPAEELRAAAVAFNNALIRYRDAGDGALGLTFVNNDAGPFMHIPGPANIRVSVEETK